jgi:hypothetical protein
VYITNQGGSYYTGSGEQHARRAPFLLLLQPKTEEEKEGDKVNGNNLRAVVRQVALCQLGHWMMGTARIKGESVTVSGAYGGDGLPKTVSRKVYEAGIPLPKELYEAWNKGGGWNGAGNEAPAMRKWACENLLK